MWVHLSLAGMAPLSGGSRQVQSEGAATTALFGMFWYVSFNIFVHSPFPYDKMIKGCIEMMITEIFITLGPVLAYRILWVIPFIGRHFFPILAKLPVTSGIGLLSKYLHRFNHQSTSLNAKTLNPLWHLGRGNTFRRRQTTASEIKYVWFQGVAANWYSLKIHWDCE